MWTMPETIKVKKNDVRFLLEATFPEYKGRTFHIEVATEVYLHDTNWHGGSFSEYKGINLGTMGVNSPAVPAPWHNPLEGAKVPLKTGFAMVRHSRFCGTDCGITFYVHPDNMVAMLKK
jgi:hypothetical protein